MGSKGGRVIGLMKEGVQCVVQSRNEWMCWGRDTGDFNINWEETLSRETFKRITSVFDPPQLINEPNRVTNSTSQADLIFTNRPRRIIKSFNVNSSAHTCDSQTVGGRKLIHMLILLIKNKSHLVSNYASDAQSINWEDVGWRGQTFSNPRRVHI